MAPAPSSTPIAEGGSTVNVLRILAKRVAMGVVVAWTVLTTVFLLFSLTDDWVLDGQEGLLRFAHRDGAQAEAAVEEMTQQYLASRGLDRPIAEQYVDWMGNMATLDWGYSLSTGEAVAPLLLRATGRTLAYVLPALVVAFGAGLSIGLYAAMNRGSWTGRFGVGIAYLLLAVPGFWVGGMVFSLQWGDHIDRIDPVIAYSPLLYEQLLPVVLTATVLLGGYVSYARAHSLEYVPATFITLVEAKGATRVRVAKHVVRNAAIPFFSMLFTEAVGLLVLAVFVIEVLFGIEGFGLLLLEAVNARDVPVLLGGTVFVIVFGVLGNIVQDVSYAVLDPKVNAV